MLKFLKAHNTIADDNIDGAVEEHAIMKNYVKLLEKNQIDERKQVHMRKNLEETLHRLLEKIKGEPETNCTYWFDAKTLCFNPKLIDMNRIEDEQFASLVIMHKYLHSNIKIIIDAEDLTWWSVLKMSEKASFNNIVDGLRLWSSIPYKIDKIFVINSNSMIVHQIIKVFLSKKIRKRTYVYSSWKKLNDSSSLFTDDNTDIDNCNRRNN